MSGVSHLGVREVRIVSLLGCFFTILAIATPALSHRGCGGSRCPLSYRLSARPAAGPVVRFRGCCCPEAPAGWGYYLRQKYHYDCSAPLVIDDELGSAILFRSPR